ncbi:hypothetical protein AVEN_171645-1 [Araneus ventricosus]|uniref:Uncharacterized protein n=1 Tax=Araneus ventricosus TaxID=182803 RepID=A0A4Y2EZA1_ARAVE|nr:hypothetical protein AVEN_171645-1 [Araneus ventricosus]
MCLYSTEIFVMIWLNAQTAADAPLNDPMVLESLRMCEKCDSEVSRAPLLIFNRHVLFLTEEAIRFPLFSKEVLDSERKKIVASLMKYKAHEK